MKNKFESEFQILTELMENNVYWTHLHKCCTYNKKDKSNSDNNTPLVKIPFRSKNAKHCANTWLKQELQDAIEQGATFIICLGKHVENNVKPWEGQLQIPKEQIFYLPHSSGAANGEWFNEERIKKTGLPKTIEALLTYCGSLK